VQVAVEICCDSSARVLQAFDSCARGPCEKATRTIVDQQLVRGAFVCNEQIYVQVTVEICYDSSKRVLRAFDSCARVRGHKATSAIIQ
jgi:hypothetical protein